MKNHHAVLFKIRIGFYSRNPIRLRLMKNLRVFMRRKFWIFYCTALLFFFIGFGNSIGILEEKLRFAFFFLFGIINNVFGCCAVDEITAHFLGKNFCSVGFLVRFYGQMIHSYLPTAGSVSEANGKRRRSAIKILKKFSPQSGVISGFSRVSHRETRKWALPKILNYFS